MSLVAPTPPASIASRLTFVTTRTPLAEAGQMQVAINFGKNESRIFSRAGLDDPNRLDRPREIVFFARAIFSRLMSEARVTGSEIKPICPTGNAQAGAPVR
jgi:hypothetical protein